MSSLYDSALPQNREALVFGAPASTTPSVNEVRMGQKSVRTLYDKISAKYHTNRARAISDYTELPAVISLAVQPKDKEGKVLKDDSGKELPAIPVRDEVIVDVVSYNSKFYYVISDGGGYGATIVRVPVNGSDGQYRQRTLCRSRPFLSCRL